jgi:catechol 2,3-dioxygenase-like lactoylglutathione lyase family enzyme
MNGYIISGIQQMGIGVSSLTESWEWYRKHFGMDCRIFEDIAEAKLMLPYTGGKPRSRHAVLALNLQSGGGFEIWQYKGREPKASPKQILAGDLGIFACKMKTENVPDTIKKFRDANVEIINDPATDPEGKMTAFVKDPYGNIFQIVEASDWFLNEKKNTGGSYGAIIGVTDIEKARLVYSDILGYDEVIYDTTGKFEDLSHLPGGDSSFRRVLLRRTKPFAGAFSRVLGNSEIELIAVDGRTPAKIFEGRYWGDKGFIHMCFDINGMNLLKEKCTSTGFPFTVDSRISHGGNSFDMGEAAGHFSYIEDPDGTLIEFVETHKVPILKKLGWYLDLRKRDPHKSLPSFILKALRFSRVK